MPPSAITGMPCFSASSADAMTAASCGTPTPATTRVVQIEPGPMPTLMESAPASISALVAVHGRDIAGDDAHRVGHLLHPADGIEHALGMAVRGVDDDDIDAGIDQPHRREVLGIGCPPDGGTGAQAALGVLGRRRD